MILHGILVGILSFLGTINFFIFIGRNNDKNYLSYTLYYFGLSGMIAAKWLYQNSSFFNPAVYFVLYPFMCYFIAGSILYLVCIVFSVRNTKLLFLYISYFILLGISLVITYAVYFYLKTDILFQSFIIPISFYALFPVIHLAYAVFISKKFNERRYYLIFVSILIIVTRCLASPILIFQNKYFQGIINFIFYLTSSLLFTFGIIDQLNVQSKNDNNTIPDSFIKKHNKSATEKDIISLLKQGLSYNEIANLLFISGKTVETHVYNIYRKTGVKSRLELFKTLNSKD